MRTNARSLATGAMAWVMLGALAAAQPQREGPPRPVLLSQGAIGEITAITFSPDSRFLYVAGADKVIRTWSLVQAGPNQNEVKPVVVQTMRWEISRGFQGRLSTIAVAPQSPLIAGGGVSARNNGDIGLWDTGTGRFAKPAVLPPQRIDPGPNGHVANVTSVSFSPNGKKLVSIDTLGAIWVWDVATGNGVVAQTGAKQSFEHRLQVAFVTDTVVAAPVLGSQSQLALIDVSGNGQTRALLAPNLDTYAIARQNNGPHWASADATGAIRVWNGVAAQPLSVIAPTAEKTVALSMSFLAGDRLVLVRDRPKLAAGGPSRLEVWNWQTGKLHQESFEVGTIDLCRTVAVSLDNRWIAYAFQDTDEVRVIPLGDNPPKMVPDVEKHIRLSGRGQAIWEAQFVDPGLKLRLRERRNVDANAAANPEDFRGFDLNELRPVAVGRAERVRSSNADAGHWSAAVRLISPRDEVVDLFFNNQLKGSISLNQILQGSVKTFCWIADQNNQEPFAIALGTERQDGIYVYSLPDAGKLPRLLRYFRDHGGAITSLTVSSDRRFLASSSIDQTVKIWSLESLRPVADGFSNRTAWGADFVNENGVLMARNVLPNGIAARRGIKNGDQLISVIPSENDRSQPEVRDAGAMLEVLSNRPIYREVHVTWQPGPPKGRPIYPAWEPLVTLFIDRHDEWVIFTPEGVFDASAAEGPKLLGWQFNMGRGFDPEFFEAGELQKNLQKPDAIKTLLTRGNAVPAGLNVADVSKDRPIVKIISPKLTDIAAKLGESVQVEAVVEYPANADRKTFQNEIYVNSQRVRQFKGDEAGADLEVKPSVTRPGYLAQHVKVNVTPSERLNSFRISTSTTTEPGQQHREATAYSEQQQKKSQQPFDVYLLAISCGNYLPVKGAVFDELKFAKAEGDEFCRAFTKGSGDFYNLRQTWRMDDFANGTVVTRKSIQEKLAEVQRRLTSVSQNDLLVIYVSGHGHVIRGQYRYIPSSPAFVTGESDEKWLNQGVGWPDFDAVSDLPCRKMYVFDTCHAGDLENAVKDREKNVKPLFDGARFRSAFIVSATSAGEKAEVPAGYPMSAFTYYWIEGMKGEADGYIVRRSSSFSVSKKDQIVKLGEILSYVGEKVPDSTQKNQRPCLFDRQCLFRMDIPICTVTAKLGAGVPAKLPE